jgi:hypothetical protein
MSTTTINDLGLSPDTIRRMEQAMGNALRFANIRITLDHRDGVYVWFTAQQEAPAVNGEVLDADGIYSRAYAAVHYMEAEGLRPVVCAYVPAEMQYPGAPTVPTPKYRTLWLNGACQCVLRLRIPRTLYKVADANGPFTRLSNDGYTGTPADHADAFHSAERWYKGEYYREQARKPEAVQAAQEKKQLRGAEAVKALQDARDEERAALAEVLAAEGLADREVGELLTSGTITQVSRGTMPTRTRTYYRGTRRLLTVVYDGITVAKLIRP